MLKIQWPYLLSLLPLPMIFRYLYTIIKTSLSSTDSKKPNPTPTGLILPFYTDLMSFNKNSRFTTHPSFSAINFKNFLKLIIWLSFILAIIRPIWLGNPIA
ncbi:MAG: hypothetical protein KBD64_05510, partial [Gammaproteobacteria bacterium]|nr:hypothetical protein [Gammaproteobacteria bacterium]